MFFSCTTGSSLFKSTRTREYTKVHVTDTESSPFDIEQLKSLGMKKRKYFTLQTQPQVSMNEGS